MAKSLNNHQAKAFLLFLRTLGGSIYAHLSLNVIREVCIYIGHRHLLLGLSSSSQLGLTVLRLYDLEEGSVCERTVPVKAEMGCVLCLRDWRTAFLLGGHPDSRQVCQLDLLTASVLKARPLLESRAYPGTVAIDGWIYVFGGKNDSPLSSCECFAPPRSRRILPDMAEAKFGFNPCACGDEVFLAAVGPGQDSLEVFYIKTRTFRTLQWTFTATHKGCVSFIVRDEMLLVTCSRRLVRVTLSGESVEERSLVLWDQNNALSSCAPLRLGDTVYWVNYMSAGLVAFSLRSMQLLEPELTLASLVLTPMHTTTHWRPLPISSERPSEHHNCVSVSLCNLPLLIVSKAIINSIVQGDSRVGSSICRYCKLFPRRYHLCCFASGYPAAL